ncbi:MAG: hypothetical protein HOQ05_11995 [Corynebacteriales bacterium]|nr:hypothetical protein [Mycobacteriales bacterium]
MAKALYGHVGTVDQRLRDEVQRLRSTNRALEFEITRLQAENDRLHAALNADQMADARELAHMTALEEPALT